MNIRYWMGIRQFLRNHLSVLNKNVPSPLCSSPFTWTSLIALQTGWKARSLVLQILWWPTCCSQVSIMSNDPDHMQTMLKKPRAYARRKSLTVNTLKSEVMCFNSYTNNRPPLFCDGTQLPCTNSSKYLGMVTIPWLVTYSSIWILQLMQHYIH